MLYFRQSSKFLGRHPSTLSIPRRLLSMAISFSKTLKEKFDFHTKSMTSASGASRINENKFMSFAQPSLSCLKSLAGRNKSFIAARIQESAFSPEF